MLTALMGMLTLLQQADKSCPASQDDTLAAQAALEKQLSAVGEDVEDINNRVGEVSTCLVVHMATFGTLTHSSLLVFGGSYQPTNG